MMDKDGEIIGDPVFGKDCEKVEYLRWENGLRSAR